MIQVDLEKYPKLTEGLIQLALAEYVTWWQVVAVPNWTRFHEMDLAVLTRAGYLWEYEIKVDQQDWNTDCRKDRHSPPPYDWKEPTRSLKYVKRFHYVYAHGLRCPDWVPEWAGLIEADYSTNNGDTGKRGIFYVTLRERRPPKDRKVLKLEDRDKMKLYQSTYHRFWRLKMEANDPS